MTNGQSRQRFVSTLLTRGEAAVYLRLVEQDETNPDKLKKADEALSRLVPRRLVGIRIGVDLKFPLRELNDFIDRELEACRQEPAAVSDERRST